MEKAYTHKMLAVMYQSIWHNIPEDLSEFIHHKILCVE